MLYMQWTTLSVPMPQPKQRGRWKSWRKINKIRAGHGGGRGGRGGWGGCVGGQGRVGCCRRGAVSEDAEEEESSAVKKVVVINIKGNIKSLYIAGLVFIGHQKKDVIMMNMCMERNTLHKGSQLINCSGVRRSIGRNYEVWWRKLIKYASKSLMCHAKRWEKNRNKRQKESDCQDSSSSDSDNIYAEGAFSTKLFNDFTRALK